MKLPRSPCAWSTAVLNIIGVSNFHRVATMPTCVRVLKHPLGAFEKIGGEQNTIGHFYQRVGSSSTRTRTRSSMTMRRRSANSIRQACDLKEVAPRAGFEPATNRLTAGCSTAELPGNEGQ